MIILSWICFIEAANEYIKLYGFVSADQFKMTAELFY